MILLRGEAGIGKTAALNKFAELARGRADVVFGACDPLSTPRPLGPVLDIAWGLGPAAQRELERACGHGVPEVFRCVMGALGTGRSKVLVFEDVHWADEATLDLLCLLARRIEREAAMLVVSHRDDEVGPGHRLRNLLGDLAGVVAVHRYALEPLSPDAVAQLIGTRRIDADEVYRITGGNPFFVTEVLAFGGDGIPATVAEAVSGRLCRASSSARRVAEAVAVFGSPAPLELVAGLVGDATEAIEELLGTGLLMAMGNGVGFRHELARMAVLDAIPVFRRTALHARALGKLRADPAARKDIALLAHHAEQAGDRDAILIHAPAAAAHAAALGAHREAAAHYEGALRFGASIPPDRRAMLLERLARERFMGSELAGSISATQAALELREALDDRLHLGEDLRWLSFVLWPSGRSTESKQAGRRAVEVLEALPPCPELAWAYTNMCQLAAYEQDGVTAAERYAQRAISLGERFGSPEIAGQARFHLGLTRYLCAGDSSTTREDDSWATREDDSWAEMDSARKATLAAGLVEPATFMAMLMGLFGTLHRDHTRAFTALDLVEKCSLDYDIPTYLLVSRGTRAFGLVNTGSWAQAAELAGSVLSHPRPPPIARILPLTALALIAARRGEARVWPLLEEALGLAEPAGWILGPARAARAEAAWLAGDHSRARAEAGAGLSLVTPHTDPWVTGELARWIRMTGGEPPPVRAAVYALEQAGDWRAAAETWARLGCPYEAALALLAGDVPALIQALQTFNALGAHPAAAIAREQLRAQGARYGRRGPRIGTQANPYGLTARQLEILELVRDGLTGRQIAARLYISPKTADHHVTAILAKMNVRSRREAARKLAQQRSDYSGNMGF